MRLLSSTLQTRCLQVVIADVIPNNKLKPKSRNITGLQPKTQRRNTSTYHPTSTFRLFGVSCSSKTALHCTLSCLELASATETWAPLLAFAFGTNAVAWRPCTWAYCFGGFLLTRMTPKAARNVVRCYKSRRPAQAPFVWVSCLPRLLRRPRPRPRILPEPGGEPPVSS